VSEIDGRDTYLLIALDERKAYPGGSGNVSFYATQNARLGKLAKAGLIVQNGALDDVTPYWRLTEEDVAFLKNVGRGMELMAERISND
jgi:hypothetical protein